tara:strand:- start:4453 stop:5082 length:630 start_codon:yes stop_codon:yes gene_type:complete
MDLKIPKGTEHLYLQELANTYRDEAHGLQQDKVGLMAAIQIYQNLEEELNGKLDLAHKELLQKEIELKHLRNELEQYQKGKIQVPPAPKQKKHVDKPLTGMYIDDSFSAGEVVDEPISTNTEFVAKVEEAKEAFAGFESTPIEEVTIPTGEELLKLPKAKLVEAAKKLNFTFNTKNPKHLMIKEFEAETEKFIQNLKDQGIYVDENITE